MENQINDWKTQKAIEANKLKEEAGKIAQQVIKNYEELQKFLLLVGRFASFYSLTNILLIYARCPNARQLQSYDSWMAQGNPVKRGMGAIRLLTSRVQKEGDREIPILGTVSLFDVSQTQNPERPAGTVVKNTKKYCSILLNTCPIEPQVKDVLPPAVSGVASAYYNNTLQQLELRANTGDSIRIFQDLVQEMSLYYISTQLDVYDRQKELDKALCAAVALCYAYYIDPKNINIRGTQSKWKNYDGRDAQKLLRDIHYAVRENKKRIDAEFYRDMNEKSRALRPLSEEIYDAQV